MSVRNETSFAIVPEWVLYGDLSAQAIRLYAVLNRHADREGNAHPSRRRLAEKMSASVDTVDRALKELVAFGAVEVKHRLSDNGSKELTSNLYTVRQIPPELRQGSRTTAATGSSTFEATGSRTSAAENESQFEREPFERERTRTSPQAAAAPIDEKSKPLGDILNLNLVDAALARPDRDERKWRAVSPGYLAALLFGSPKRHIPAFGAKAVNAAIDDFYEYSADLKDPAGYLRERAEAHSAQTQREGMG